MNRQYLKFMIGFTMLFFVANCSAPKTNGNSEEKERDKPLSKNLPVGMVELSCKIEEFMSKAEKSFCLATILKIHAYGNSVRALSENKQYEFEIEKYLLKNLDQSSIIGKVIRCKLVKVPDGMQRLGSNKLKIISFEIL